MTFPVWGDEKPKAKLAEEYVYQLSIDVEAASQSDQFQLGTDESYTLMVCTIHEPTKLNKIAPKARLSANTVFGALRGLGAS